MGAYSRDIEIQALSEALVESWQEERDTYQREMEIRIKEEVRKAVAVAIDSFDCDEASESRFDRQKACDCREHLEKYKNTIRKEIEEEFQCQVLRAGTLSSIAFDRERLTYEDSIRDLQARLEAASTLASKEMEQTK